MNRTTAKKVFLLLLPLLFLGNHSATASWQPCHHTTIYNQHYQQHTAVVIPTIKGQTTRMNRKELMLTTFRSKANSNIIQLYYLLPYDENTRDIAASSVCYGSSGVSYGNTAYSTRTTSTSSLLSMMPHNHGASITRTRYHKLPPHPPAVHTSRTNTRMMMMMMRTPLSWMESGGGGAAWRIFGWAITMSSFLIKNYVAKTTDQCWPSSVFLKNIPVRGFNFLHSISAMLFAGSIITTTMIEWIVVRAAATATAAATGSSSNTTATNALSVLLFWFEQVSLVERFVVLPALTGLIVSGVGQCFHRYGGGVKYAPRHVKSSLHLLTLFGIWWGWTDQTTQGPARTIAAQQQLLLQETKGDPNIMLHPIFYQRRISNLVSCLFLFILYGFMILKPGYREPNGS